MGKRGTFAASVRNSACSSFQLVWLLRGEIVVLRIIFGDVIELPFIFVERRHLARSQVPWRGGRSGGGDPAVVIDGAVANHFEILGVAFRRRIGIGLVERVAMLTPSIGFCLMPLTVSGA